MTPVASFVLELYRPGLDRAGGARLVRSIRRAIGAGRDGIGYLGSTLAPRDEVCYVRLQAAERASVERLVERLAFDGARISEIVDLG